MSRNTLYKHEHAKSYITEGRTKFADDPLFTTKTTMVILAWLLTIEVVSICLCKPFSCTACLGIRIGSNTKKIAKCLFLEMPCVKRVYKTKRCR